MSPAPPRVVLFADAFHEPNGVGTVSKEFVAFAQRRQLPFCCVHAGPETRVIHDGPVVTIELKRGLSFALDKDLRFDPILSRHRNWIIEQLRLFGPDLIHITGPGDIGLLGFWVSNRMRVPMVASWHTNLHQYLSRRVQKSLRFMPRTVRERIAAVVERYSFRALMAFYHYAHFLLAPNHAMVEILRARTGRPAYDMRHGVDTDRFSPHEGGTGAKEFCVGWVGRLTPEKNVRAFAELERRLLAAGETDFRMLLVGDGSEREWLRSNMQSASLPGFLYGEELAAAFAAMDAFVFPSETDTFGLVILEAMASGVPVVLSSQAGSRVGIRDGVEGLLSDDFAASVLSLMRCRSLRHEMGRSAQSFARSQSWGDVFQELYRTYSAALETDEVRNW